MSSLLVFNNRVYIDWRYTVGHVGIFDPSCELAPRIREYSWITHRGEGRGVSQPGWAVITVCTLLCCALAMKSCTYSPKSWDLCSESLTSGIAVRERAVTSV